LQDEDTDHLTKEQLARALEIREFASNELKLPDNKSYLSYVALDRPYVSWAVFAAPEFSLQAKTWCFWIVGCIPYRGYFSEEKAEQFSQSLLKQGYEIYIAPIPAYSTLGWFDDPLLSSMLDQGEVITANYIFHELAHQEIYIPDDSEFNEAFASAVAELGVVSWLYAQNNHQALENYLRRLEIREQVYTVTRSFRQELSTIYAEDLTDREKRKKKKLAFSEYKFNIRQLVNRLGGSPSYAKWVLSNTNNAKLSATSTYQELIPAFKSFFKQCDENFEKYYQAVARMSLLTKAQRRKSLLMDECYIVSGEHS
ncbi:MAG: aminopeptidase, partial [Pseudomonadota bacterium]